GEMFSDGLLEKGQARARNPWGFVLPSLIVHERIFETAVSAAIAAIDVSGCTALPKQSIPQERLTVDTQLPVSTYSGRIQVAFGRVRDETQGECPSRILTERAAFLKGVFAKLSRCDQRCLSG
ncbi:MAG TPA: hypothetical protein VLQ80_13180, partial [Candidatus Saccharimonadia bacterium]|nr:hypothetical protein [Candidatus Saccharimonadia bacterium]